MGGSFLFNTRACCNIIVEPITTYPVVGFFFYMYLSLKFSRTSLSTETNIFEHESCVIVFEMHRSWG